MQNIAASSYAMNTFDFSMKTSSGDTLSLNMYDQKSSNISYEKTASSQSMTLSLEHAYGYKFHYEGDGIDEQDKQEIAKAMQKIQPLLEKYFENIKENGISSDASASNTAYDINSLLPKMPNANTQNYLNDQTMSSIDKILQKAQDQNEQMLKSAQKLFDSLLKQNSSFELYM
jgi:hypothetical protein